MVPSKHPRGVRRLLLVSGSAFIVIAIAMTLTGVLLGPQGSDVGEKLARVAEQPQTRVSFMIASLLPAAMAPFTIGLALWVPFRRETSAQDQDSAARRAAERDPLRVAAIVLTLGYAPLSTFSYCAQYLLVPRLAEIDPDQAALWYLGNDASFALGLDLFAYLLWGVAALFVAWRLWAKPGIVRGASVVLALSGITSVIAFPAHVGHVSGGGLLSAASGGLSVVAALAVLFYATRPRSRATDPR